MAVAAVTTKASSAIAATATRTSPARTASTPARPAPAPMPRLTSRVRPVSPSTTTARPPHTPASRDSGSPRWAVCRRRRPEGATATTTPEAISRASEPSTTCQHDAGDVVADAARHPVDDVAPDQVHHDQRGDRGHAPVPREPPVQAVPLLAGAAPAGQGTGRGGAPVRFPPMIEDPPTVPDDSPG